jgi:multidrug efflux pump subunit AcrB
MNEMASGLSVGLIVSIVAVFLLLTANFQSVRLALVAVASVPAVVAGVLLMLWVTGTTLNIQSFIGAIMAIGVAMANAILLVTFAETRRREGDAAADAAIQGAGGRLRAILMTSCAMIAGMLPMALAFGEAGQQNAPLGRAVIGGLAASMVATLFILPGAFALLQKRVAEKTPSLDPDDPDSSHYSPAAAEGA